MNASKAGHGGFTLIELLVTVTVLSILISVAVPAFTSSQLTTTLRTTANSLVAGAHLARSEAIKRNVRTRMCVSTGGPSATCTTGDWNQGWIITTTGATPEVLHREDGISTRYHVVASADNFDFQPTGVDSTAGTFTVCRATPTAGPQERVVTVDAVGRAWINRTSNGTCP